VRLQILFHSDRRPWSIVRRLLRPRCCTLVKQPLLISQFPIVNRSDRGLLLLLLDLTPLNSEGNLIVLVLGTRIVRVLITGLLVIRKHRLVRNHMIGLLSLLLEECLLEVLLGELLVSVEVA
jgi:hypothetical protein